MSKNLTVLGNGLIKGDFYVGSSTLDHFLYVNKFNGDINISRSLKIKKNLTIDNDIIINGKTNMKGNVNLSNANLSNVIINTNMINYGESSLYKSVGIGIDYPTDNNLILHISGNTRLDGNLILNGTTTIIDTNINTSDQLVINTYGSGASIIVSQYGNDNIAIFNKSDISKFIIKNGSGVMLIDLLVSIDVN